MKRMITILSLLLCVASCKEVTPGPGEELPPVQLHTVMEMNREPAELNSHAGDELSGVLQPMYAYYRTLPHETLTSGAPEDQALAIYPRVKRMADGRYILFYHGGQYGSRIWYLTSNDFKDWSAPQLLYQPYKINGDIRRFVNPDAALLPGGDLLMVCSYRASSGYNSGLDCGLSFRRSADGGTTWSDPLNVEVGPNWEPYLLVLPDGRLHCYFTDATPWTRNSGTSVITSEDGGATWSAKKRVCRLYKYDYYTADSEKQVYNGEKIYTDQMPCFRVLNDGHTLAGWLEDRIEDPEPRDCSLDKYSSVYEMSLVWHDGLDWEDLGENKAGPERRLSRIVRGAAGYISTFRSGETVLSCGISGLLHLRMSDATVTHYYGSGSWEKESNWLLPFDGTGFWGSTEVVAPTILAAAMHCGEGMQTGLLYLNHRIDAERQTIVPDGDCAEWKTDKAFFLGLPGGEELLLRAAADDKNLYLAADCLETASGSPAVTLQLCREGGKAVKVTLKKGLSQKTSSDGIVTVSRKAEKADGASGYTAEASIPLSLLGAGKGDTLRLYAVFENGSSKEVFSFSKKTDSSTWQKIKL